MIPVAIPIARWDPGTRLACALVVSVEMSDTSGRG